MSRSRDIANLLGAGSVILDGAPSALDTLNELAAAIGDDANYASTVTTALNNRVLKTGGDTITVSSGTTVPLTIQNNGTGNSFVVNDEASDTSPVIIDANGNVGIGTSTPLRKLDISGGGLAFTDPSGSSRSIHWGDSLTNIYPVTIEGGGSTGFLSFKTSTFGNSSVERMRIDSAGNIGIGTTSPQSLLDIKNGTTYSSSGSFLVKIQQNTNSPGSNGLSVMNAWAGTGSTIFEVAMGWNGSVAGYYPAFSIDGIGNITISNVTAGALRMKLPTNMTLEAPVVYNVQTGTSYTLVLTDAGRVIEMNNASANTLTVPTDASVNFPIGTVIDIFQTGAGQTTVGGAGVTINARPGLKLSGQWATATLIKRAANTWLLTGSLSA